MNQCIVGIDGFALGEELAKEGLVPEECASIELLTPADGVVQLRYTINLTPDKMLKFAAALHRVAEKNL